MVIPQFSIILQGLVDPKDLLAVENACKFSDNVIISTWSNSVSDKTARAIEDLGGSLVFADDPGTISKYQQAGISKGFNFHRQITGTLVGAKSAKYDKVIRTRTDVTADFTEVLRLLLSSRKHIASANITAVCPARLFAKSLWFHGSDWLIACDKKHILDSFQRVLEGPSESELLDAFPELATEQLWTLSSMLSEFTLESIRSKSESAQETHRDFQNRIANLPAEMIDLRSTKYKNRAIKWATYNTLDYSDHTKLGPLKILPFYLAAKMLR